MNYSHSFVFCSFTVIASVYNSIRSVYTGRILQASRQDSDVWLPACYNITRTVTIEEVFRNAVLNDSRDSILLMTLGKVFQILRVLVKNKRLNQGRSKRSGWSGHGRTNNRAGNFYFYFFI